MTKSERTRPLRLRKLARQLAKAKWNRQAPSASRNVPVSIPLLISRYPSTN